MAKREPLFEADLGENGGLIRLWDTEDVERFIAVEQSFWRAIHQGNMSEPFNVVESRLNALAKGLRRAVEAANGDVGSNTLVDVFGRESTRVPLSTSHAAQGIATIHETYGLEAARGAVAITIPPDIWQDSSRPSLRSNYRGMIEQIIHQNGVTPQSVEAAKRALNGVHARASQVLGQVLDRANEQIAIQEADFAASQERMQAQVDDQVREVAGLLSTTRQTVDDLFAKYENTHNGYLEQMKLKAPVEYWRTKAGEHRTAAKILRNWLVGFFALMIGAYVIGFAGLHQQLASFLLQFQGSTGALLVMSAAFALLASLPLWVGRLLVKFYLSEHHLATDAKEREIMTQAYLALTSDGAVDEKDRSLILAALFRSTPDGVVKDTTQPDTSPAAIFSKLWDSR